VEERGVAEARRLARRRLPAPVFQAIEAGAEAGVTRDDNMRAFTKIQFAPPAVARPDVPSPGAPGWPAPRDLCTSVLGTAIELPVIASPVGVQAVHPAGEAGIARGTAQAGTAMGLSEFASLPVASVIRANPRLFFQVHWSADKEELHLRAERARAAGASALILTLDWAFASGRDWGSPPIPENVDLAAMARHARHVLARPGYLARWMRSGALPSLTVPNMAAAGGLAPGFFAAYRAWQQVKPPSWADIAWLRGQWDGPFMIKGIMRPDDARHAVDIGATAVSVSNHGGNNLDGTPASIRALPAVAAAVGDQAEVLLDGGIRRAWPRAARPASPASLRSCGPALTPPSTPSTARASMTSPAMTSSSPRTSHSSGRQGLRAAGTSCRSSTSLSACGSESPASS
jgi:L-lactate dehydrogenase (cytochrome)